MDWFRPFIQAFLSGLLIMILFSPGKSIDNKMPLAAILSKPIGCSPGNWGERNPASKNQIPILPGWGHYHFGISSTSDSAGIYFDQGLSLYYSYHPWEAASSFMVASSFDPGCAMCYWGQALAKGPYYNGFGRYSTPNEVPAIIEAMNKNSSGATEKEKDLIIAMKQRYLMTGDEGQRKGLNRNYAEAMKTLISKYPNDLDIRALYIDAVMLEHPWEFWNTDGSPKPWTPELIPLCEGILKVNPHHPGAMHYYIHLTEASRDPGRALPQAEELRISMPGVPHMVHMSSHVYERTGHFGDGVLANDLAFAADKSYNSLVSGTYSLTRNSHYLAVQAFCAINGGMLKDGMPAIYECGSSMVPSRSWPFSQYVHMFPTLAWVRMGQWQSIIESLQPNYDVSFARILDNFARGLAYLRRQVPDSPKIFLEAIDQSIDDPGLTVPDSPFSPFILPAKVARNILAAEILSVQKRTLDAENLFRLAIQIEDSIIYFEPKRWLLPARQYFGTRLLEWKRPKEAEKVFRDDLIMNPGNGWSLTGLYLSLLAEQNPTEALHYKSMAEKAFSKSDLVIKSAVF